MNESLLFLRYDVNVLLLKQYIHLKNNNDPFIAFSHSYLSPIRRITTVSIMTLRHRYNCYATKIHIKIQPYPSYKPC